MRKVNIVILLGSTLGCTEKKFIGSKVLAQFPTETIYYDGFRTDIDNYTIEIKSKKGNEVEHLFDYYINDAVFTETTLQALIKRDTAIVFSKHAVSQEKGQTKHGIFVVMRKL
jgi:hypothetical protein